MDQVQYIQDEISYLKGILIENIDYLLDRGVILEELQEKTEELEQQSVSFQRESKKVNRREWLTKNRMKLQVAVGTVGVSSLAWGLFMLL